MAYICEWDPAKAAANLREHGVSFEEATNVVRYALAGDRVALVADERFRSRSLNYDNVWVLDRIDSQ